MVSLGTIVGLTFIVSVHTVAAAILTRFFRLHLSTRWGAMLYTVLVIPVVLTVSLLLLGQLPIFAGMERNTVALLTILLPLLLGVTIDFFWMPTPDEVEMAIERQ